MYEGLTTNDDQQALYRHTQCEEWGLAILAWEQGNKRGYQFEDGRLRIFKQGYYDLLEEVDRPSDRAAKTISKLERKLGLTAARRKAPNENRSEAPSFDDQLSIFAQLYPNSFDDDKWLEKIRGGGDIRRLKRHREGAIDAAKQQLAEAELDALIAKQRFGDVYQRIRTVFAGTDLASATQCKLIDELDDRRQRALAVAARDLLWGDDTYELRFERWVGTLGEVIGQEPPWQLATALSALVHPEEHICIRPTPFRAQAAWMAPRIRYIKAPNAPLYTRYLAMVQTLRDELQDAGHHARDLLDIYDFMWTTLRPAAKKKLAARNEPEQKEAA